MEDHKSYITSHFIGIKLKPSPFIPLFVNLQTYLLENDINSVIQLSNIHSLHVSLYYLDKNLTAKERNSVTNTIQEISQGKINKHIALSKFHFFKNGDIDILGYLTTNEDGLLTEINKSLAVKYQRNDIADNSYDYIPHVTLFRVLDSQIFSKYKSEIVNIVNKFISESSKINLYQEICLFEVCSKHSPEIQIPLPE